MEECKPKMVISQISEANNDSWFVVFKKQVAPLALHPAGVGKTTKDTPALASFCSNAGINVLNLGSVVSFLISGIRDFNFL